MKPLQKTPYSLISLKLKPLINQAPESNLMFAVIMQAVSDLTYSTTDSSGYKKMPELKSSIDYLFMRDEIPQAGLCGIESEYVKDVIYKIFSFMSLDGDNTKSAEIKEAFSMMPHRE